MCENTQLVWRSTLFVILRHHSIKILLNINFITFHISSRGYRIRPVCLCVRPSVNFLARNSKEQCSITSRRCLSVSIILLGPSAGFEGRGVLGLQPEASQGGRIGKSAHRRGRRRGRGPRQVGVQIVPILPTCRQFRAPRGL